jgi:trk system potassium uptake protein TrkH
MFILGIVAGYRDLISLVSFIFAALSTGGFSPIDNMATVASQFPLNFILIFGMILGAANFFVLAGLFKGRIKEFFKSEFSAFLGLSIVSIIVVTVAFKLSFFDAVFQVFSAMSTTGFSYLSVPDFSDGLKLFLVFLMFVGGASFSTAGGIKIYRFLLIFKTIKKAISDSITKQDAPVKLFGRTYTNPELIEATAIVVLMIIFMFIGTLIVSLYGFHPIDALFETTSAIATTGLSAGIIGPSLALELKWLFIFLMIVGRVEILAFFIIFSRKKEPEIV